MVANDFPRGVPGRARSIEHGNRPAVLSSDRDLPRAYAAPIVGVSSQHRFLPAVGVQPAGIERQQFLFTPVPQHANQGGIGVEQSPLGGTDVNAFLQTFKQLGKALFFFAFFGHVPSQAAHAHHFVILHDRVQHAFEVANLRALLQADPDGARPAAFLEESGQAGFHFRQRRFRKKVVHLVVHDFRIGDGQ